MTAVVVVSHPACCAVCGGLREVLAHLPGVTNPTRWPTPCPHCGPAHLPIVYLRKARP